MIRLKVLLPIILVISSSLYGQKKEENRVKLEEITFQAEEQEKIYGEQINTEIFKNTPTLTGSFTDILRTLPYVSINTEVSSQYMVRGGNYDENIVYVNGLQIFKPHLVRSGKQEGLSFLNPQMAANVNFIPGGWEPKYGDAMSSVLDVIYRTPQKFELSTEFSLLGGHLTVGGITSSKKLSFLLGARYLNRTLLLNTLGNQTEFNPSSADIQSHLEYKINNDWKINFIGMLNTTSFRQIPHSRETNFGTLHHPVNLKVHYLGREQDKFKAVFGSLSLHYKPSNPWDLSLDAFIHHFKEEEYFDIQGGYFLTTMEEENNTIATSEEISGQIDHARNDLDAIVAGIQHRGKYKINANTALEWGVTFQKEDNKDLMNEWQVIDSAGYNLQPLKGKIGFGAESSDNENLALNYAISARNSFALFRSSAYTQWTKKFFWNDAKVLFNIGMRTSYLDFNKELNLSPRMQIAIRPDWATSQLFRFSTGYYIQPPLYKEFRNPYGEINNKVKAQKSVHFIAGHDYEFFMWNRPFKLTTEVYYKNMWDINPYFIDNVRIKYTALNNTVGYAYGIDARLFGEFIPGVDSWLSLSYGKTQQNINQQGWIPRPTEPRFKASLFFQDYMPMYPSLSVNVNLIYASGLPNGAPLFTNPYDFKHYLPDYKRVDIGLTKVLINNEDDTYEKGFLSLKKLSLGLNVFNVFDTKNTISNQWIRDVNSEKIYGVPNRLTGRFINLNVNMSF